MDSLITAAAHALAAGDPLAALKCIALRDDAPALALRGIAMAQLGDLSRAKELLGNASRAFGAKEPMARARCNVAEAEIALVSRDLGRSMQGLGAARSSLEAYGDLANAAHAGYLEARRLLLIGRLDEAERILDDLDAGALPMTSRVGYELVVAGIAMRRIRTEPAREALDRAARAAADVGHAALTIEVDRAVQAFEAPAARLVACDRERLLRLGEVEALIASNVLIIDACRNVVRTKSAIVSLASRPVLFALVRVLGESWRDDASREELLVSVFRAREADESHRVRLRVEIGRLRQAIKSLAHINATERGFVLEPHEGGVVVVLAPPVENEHGEVLALLADGEAWSSSALALALDVSPRTVQRALDALEENGKAEWFGQGRARRWIAVNIPGFPTSLLLPANGVVSLDEDMKNTAAEIIREYGPFPGVDSVHGVSFDGRQVWMATGNRLDAFDPDSGAMLSSLDVAANAGTAFDGEHLFQIAEAVIRKIDPKTGKVLATIPAPGDGDDSGIAWAEGSLWVGQHRGRKIHQVDPETGTVLRTIESDRFVTGVTWVDGELWHGTWENNESDVRRIDPASGEVLERLNMPVGIGVSGLESDGGDRFFCGGGTSPKVRSIRRPKRTDATT